MTKTKHTELSQQIYLIIDLAFTAIFWPVRLKRLPIDFLDAHTDLLFERSHQKCPSLPTLPSVTLHRAENSCSLRFAPEDSSYKVLPACTRRRWNTAPSFCNYVMPISSHNCRYMAREASSGIHMRRQRVDSRNFSASLPGATHDRVSRAIYTGFAF